MPPTCLNFWEAVVPGLLGRLLVLGVGSGEGVGPSPSRSFSLSQVRYADSERSSSSRALEVRALGSPHPVFLETVCTRDVLGL